MKSLLFLLVFGIVFVNGLPSNFKDDLPVIHKSSTGKMRSSKTIFGDSTSGFPHPADIMQAVQKTIDNFPRIVEKSVTNFRSFFSFTIPSHSRTFFSTSLPRVADRFVKIMDPKSYDSKGKLKITE